ncbi:hypothetical protein BROUX41_003876 [Berkeleyomyces rouxiae]|uniref:uncharacterized protein n=1 Tax=Berkeleyomyces rouxiae TaxID=2035830 RepID=UPI003B7D4A91
MTTPLRTATRLARPCLHSPRFFTSAAPPSARSSRQLLILGASFALLGAGSAAYLAASRVPVLALDAPAGSHPLQASKTVISASAAPGSTAVVATGNASVPTLPLTLALPNGTEYTLVGFGVRTVSFLRIQVYVAGYYVATADLPRLAAALIDATTTTSATDSSTSGTPRSLLLPGAERSALQAQLLDGAASDALWDGVLECAGVRSLFRVTPVRDTDFHHLRDGFVRAIQARTRPGGPPQWAFGDAGFVDAMADFRAIFARGKVPKQKELLLIREADGELRVLYDDGTTGGRVDLGGVKDERVSRMLWLNWLGGKNVASEAARKSISEGLMDLVARPIGSV